MLPKYFKPILWSSRFTEIDPETNFRLIIINTVNYGDWIHWQWLIGYYGKERLRRIIEQIAASEFRPSALKLMALLIELTHVNYAYRGDMVRGQATPVKIS